MGVVLHTLCRQCLVDGIHQRRCWVTDSAGMGSRALLVEFSPLPSVLREDLSDILLSVMWESLNDEV